MIRIADIVAYAARNGLTVPARAAAQALAAVDRPTIVKDQTQRFEVRVWDGESVPPIADRGRWLQLSPVQLAKWDAMTPSARLGYLPRAGVLMQARNRGTLGENEREETVTMPVPQDGIGLMALEAAAAGKAMYFVLVDGRLRYWQPVTPHEAGRILMELVDEEHPYHWKRVADRHIAVEVEREVDEEVLNQALTRALELLEPTAPADSR